MISDAQIREENSPEEAERLIAERRWEEREEARTWKPWPSLERCPASEVFDDDEDGEEMPF